MRLYDPGRDKELEALPHKPEPETKIPVTDKEVNYKFLSTSNPYDYSLRHLNNFIKDETLRGEQFQLYVKPVKEILSGLGVNNSNVSAKYGVLDIDIFSKENKFQPIAALTVRLNEDLILGTKKINIKSKILDKEREYSLIAPKTTSDLNREIALFIDLAKGVYEMELDPYGIRKLKLSSEQLFSVRNRN